MPHALEQVRKLKTTVDENNFEELFRLLGTSNTSRPVHGIEDLTEDGEYTSAERTVVEAALKADGSGQLVKFPFINNQLQRILCRWAYKLCTAGGFRLPAFALADDGYLALHNGRVYSGSNWMPEDHAITSLGSRRLLEVRYPIRAKDDLLPLKNLTGPDTVARLMNDLGRQGSSMSEQEAVQQIVIEQLRLEHTITLHSKTAAKNGGDYDFDVVCVVEEQRVSTVGRGPLQSPRNLLEREGQTEEEALGLVEPAPGRGVGERQRNRDHHRPDDVLHGCRTP